MRKVKIRMARKAVLAVLVATLQWSTVAFLQQQTTRMMRLSISSASSASSASSSSLLALKDNSENGGEVTSFLTRIGNPFWTQPDKDDETQDMDKVLAPPQSSGSLPPGLSAIQTLVQPLQEALDDASSDWVLSYADLRPDSSKTWAGQAFLATNLLYLVAGIILSLQGDVVFGFLVEVCSVASFGYHYTQLEADGNARAPTVRLAVLIDYVFALVSMGLATFYLVGSLDAATTDVFVSIALSLGFLGMSWVYEKGRPYMFFHSLWHVFGAYTGLLVGTLHNQQSLPTFF